MFTRVLIISSILSISMVANAQPVGSKEGGTCYANGKKGVYTIEEGNGHLWCKVGNRETECGGVPERCSDKPQRASIPFRDILNDMTRTPSSLQ